MKKRNASLDLDVFLNPESVAVIGASERPGSWGSFIMRGLLSSNFPGQIYPVNSRAGQLFGIPAFEDMLRVISSVQAKPQHIPFAKPFPNGPIILVSSSVSNSRYSRSSLNE